MRFFTLALTAILTSCLSSNAAAGDLDWPDVSITQRPGVYWWWMGSAVDKENITRELETLQQAGIGGVTVIPIYGVAREESRSLQLLSPEWMEMLSHTIKEAKRLNMWVDMPPGSGWPYGGPMVTDADSDITATFENGVVVEKFSRRRVKRAAPGGEGKAINPYSPTALSRYLHHFGDAFQRNHAPFPRAMYHDSFEFNGNWHASLPAEFQKRRGYDLREHLPELFGTGDPDRVARIKSDYRETLSDLHLDYMRTLVNWAHSKGSIVRNQAHGSPANLLDLYAASDIPETEIFGASQFSIPGLRREASTVPVDQPQPLINRMASSAAHVMGRPLVAAESCTWLRNHFHTALSQMKPEIDQLFLCGANHVYVHGTCYSPQDAPWPGWLFYASMQFNSRNAIWRDVPHLNAYITRCQSILQSGQPDNDVALYWPFHDIWHDAEKMQQLLTVHKTEWMDESTCAKVARQLLSEGVSSDFISDRQLCAGLGSRYRAIIIPPTSHMPLATLQAILNARDRGQPVVFVEHLPQDVPGLHRHETRRRKLHDLLSDCGKLVTTIEAIPEALRRTDVIQEPMVEAGLQFIRRTHDEGHHYFIANVGSQPVDQWVPLGTSFQSAVLMNAQSGKTGTAPGRNGHEIYLQLQPGETRIIRTFHSRSVDGPRWPVLSCTDRSPVTISGTWNITFIEGGPQLPGDITTTELQSWTAMGDNEAQRFAGTARYSIEFDLPKAPADDWILDLGDVRESARVTINGQAAADLYSVPFQASIGQHLSAGRNRLEIEVTNLSANRIRDLDLRQINWKRFKDINFVDQNYKKFDASTWKLTASGLLGPVTLTAMRHITP